MIWTSPRHPGDRRHGKWVTPGLFAALTDLGIYDVDAVEDSNDISAGSATFNAALDIAPVDQPASLEPRKSAAPVP